MMSFTRRMSSAVLAKRAFSSVSPKVAIGQNILRLDAIFNAADEAALTKAAAAPLPSVDPNNLPVQLKSLSGWYALDSVSAGDKFVPNPNAWQNKNFWEYAADEAKRPETWPFIVGFIVMNLIWKYMHESLPESAFKESKYYQLIEGTAFGHHDEHASECHDGECKVVAAHH